MASKKYPLEKLVELRQKQKDDAGTALAAAVRARAAAEAAAARAEADRLLAEARASAVRKEEEDALRTGGLTVADLQRAQAWEHRVETERQKLVEKEAAERASADAASAKEGERRGELTQKQADAKVVENDRARHQARLAREAEAKAEEEANEAWRKR